MKLQLLTDVGIIGKSLSQSISTTPALLRAPAPLLAQQWKILFDSDRLVGPAVTLLSSSVFGYIAWRDHSWTKPAVLYASSASLLLALIPASLVLLEPINQKLEYRTKSLAGAALTDTSAEAGLKKEETVHALVDKWATINLGRALVATTSAVLAVWAAVERAEVVPATTRLATGANRMGN